MKLKEQLRVSEDIDVPWNVWRFVGEGAKVISLSGEQVSLSIDADYGTLEELRQTIEWYVDQLGGKVKWGN